MIISIVIPVYNEKNKIKDDILAAEDFILRNNFSGEIIIVDDGSDDGTADTANSINISEGIDLHVLNYKPHRGKGFAVKKGFIATKGDFIAFIDSGLCIPYDKISSGIRQIESGECDISHASRKLPESKIIRNKSLLRRIIPGLFRLIFIHWLKIPSNLTDTQCGLKVYKGDIGRKLYEQCKTDGFLFDVEIIMLAVKHGYKVSEFPVEWTADLDSRLSVIKNSLETLKELFNLKRLESNL